MADKTAVNVTLTGDSSDLEKSFAKVGGAAQEMGRKLDATEESAGRFNRSMEGAETAGDRAERGVRGLTDILGVAADSFGLPIGPALAFGGAITQVGGGLADLAPELARLPGLQQAAAAASKVQAGAQAALNAVMNANPIFLVITAIALLVGAFITAYTTSETFRDIVNGVFGAVVGAAQTAFDTILGVIQGPFNWARDNWQLLLAILTGPVGLAVLAITGHFDDMVSFMTGLPGRVTTAVTGLFDKATSLATDAYNWVTGKFDDVVTFMTGLPGRVTSGVAGLFDKPTSLATDAKSWITGKFDDVIDFVGGLPRRATTAVSGLFDEAKQLATDAKSWITGKFDDVVSFVAGLPRRITSGMSGLFDGMKSEFRSAVNGIIDMWNSIEIPSFHVHIAVPLAPDIDFNTPSIGLPDIPRFHQGGIVPGLPSQETLAILRGGEQVIANPGASGSVYNITVNSLDPRSASKLVVDAIRQYERHNGPVFARA